MVVLVIAPGTDDGGRVLVVDVVDEDNASSNAYALVFRGKGSAAAGPLPMSMPRLVVHYQHKFVREGGRWYMKYKETRWLFRADESIPGTPIAALQANRGTEIKRRAQAAGF